MKHEWRKHEKDLYMPKQEPQLLTVPKLSFIQIPGIGNPNSDDFSRRAEILFSLAYAIKMMPKKGYTPIGYFDYTVYPLEGLWDLTEEGRRSNVLNKDELVYTIMIRQPSFVTKEILENAIEIARKKKPSPLYDDVFLDSIEEGLSVQMLHIGSYDDEPQTFRKMKEFIEDNHLEIATLVHREIYLSDARKVESARLKTVLRYMVNTKG